MVWIREILQLGIKGSKAREEFEAMTPDEQERKTFQVFNYYCRLFGVGAIKTNELSEHDTTILLIGIHLFKRMSKRRRKYDVHFKIDSPFIKNFWETYEQGEIEKRFELGINKCRFYVIDKEAVITNSEKVVNIDTLRDKESESSDALIEEPVQNEEVKENKIVAIESEEKIKEKKEKVGDKLWAEMQELKEVLATSTELYASILKEFKKIYDKFEEEAKEEKINALTTSKFVVFFLNYLEDNFKDYAVGKSYVPAKTLINFVREKYGWSHRKNPGLHDMFMSHRLDNGEKQYTKFAQELRIPELMAKHKKCYQGYPNEFWMELIHNWKEYKKAYGINTVQIQSA